jgi:Zn-dependent protease
MSRVPLFTILGFRISLDYSLFVLAALLIFNLGGGFFPEWDKNISTVTAYIFAVTGTAGMFASIIFHELSHSLVARRFGLPVGGITLFIFGGIAELQHEPDTPHSEFWIAIAGPIASFVLAIGFYLINLITESFLPPAASGLFFYLSFVNLMLGVFNLLPAFPLDGGRVLRSILWWFNGDQLKSTRVAARLGTVLGYGVMALGVVYEIAIEHNYVAGLWYMLIGFFITNAADQSRAQAEIVYSLRGVPLGRVMKENIGAVPAGATLQVAVTAFFERLRRKSFPVAEEGGRIIGMLPMRALATVPRERWALTLVREVTQPLDYDSVASPYDDAFDTLMRMFRDDLGELIIVNDGVLAGSIEQRDLIDFHRMRLSAAGQDAAPNTDG